MLLLNSKYKPAIKLMVVSSGIKLPVVMIHEAKICQLVTISHGRWPVEFILKGGELIIKVQAC